MVMNRNYYLLFRQFNESIMRALWEWMHGAHAREVYNFDKAKRRWEKGITINLTSAADYTISPIGIYHPLFMIKYFFLRRMLPLRAFGTFFFCAFLSLARKMWYIFKTVIWIHLICRIFRCLGILLINRMETIFHFVFAIIVRNWNRFSFPFFICILCMTTVISYAHYFIYSSAQSQSEMSWKISKNGRVNER